MTLSRLYMCASRRQIVSRSSNFPGRTIDIAVCPCRSLYILPADFRYVVKQQPPRKSNYSDSFEQNCPMCNCRQRLLTVLETLDDAIR